VPAVAALALGLLHALAFAPWPAWWLQSASLAALFALWVHTAVGAPRHRRVAIAAGFGFGWFAAGLCWLYVSMHDYGGLPAVAAAAAVLLFAGYLSLFPGTVLWACGDALAGPRPLAAALRIGGVWALAEWLRGLLFTGFPWLAIGYAHIDGPLAGFAPLLGVNGVNGLAAGAAAALATAGLAFVRARRATPSSRAATYCLRDATTLVAGLLVAGLALSHVQWSRPHGEPIRIRLLQGNVPQSMKFDPEVSRRTMAMYADMALAEKADLTVMPETAWTVPWDNTPPQIAHRLTEPVGNAHPLAIGLPTFAGAPGRNGLPMPTNSVMLLRPGEAATHAVRYDKRHLVPFGEFVPPLFAWFVEMMDIPLGSFARGDAVQPAFVIGSQRLGFDICYEDLFGAELLAQVHRPMQATILVNVSNIAWFGRSHALPQHLAIARMRAIETARPMLRATNTGTTASIDAHGQVRAMLVPFSIGTLADTVQGTEGLTPYARVGDSGALALALLAIGASLLRGRNR
jgi:apolipoprotein N-acyltransferase